MLKLLKVVKLMPVVIGILLNFLSSFHFLFLLIYLLIFLSFFSPPVNYIGSPGQQDPTQESREVQEGILSVLDRGADVSVRVLEQLLGAGEVKIVKEAH